jgi:hypothetical protein
VGEARWLHTTRVANVAMSKFDANSEMPYEKLVKNLEVVKARLNRPLTLSEKVFLPFYTFSLTTVLITVTIP